MNKDEFSYIAIKEDFVGWEPDPWFFFSLQLTFGYGRSMEQSVLYIPMEPILFNFRAIVTKA
jgi:hypothetical protein